jgi:hypothetical protein
MFYDACHARGLLEDDVEWEQCLLEASEIQGGQRLRSLFVTTVLFCHPLEPDQQDYGCNFDEISVMTSNTGCQR